ncbi:MAG: putative toxin-antitoxin system toxin component, PIN family [Burkholderiales bacterium]|nr:putative toxin-antitoxin system toxin component, PIN family [Burkholderiales bacterium]
MTSSVRPVRVVLDTNVLVAILAFDDPALEPLRAAWDEGSLVPLIDNHCEVELQRVLAYPAIARRAARAGNAVRTYLACCERVADDVPPTAALPRCRDPEDQKFLVLAGRGRADALLTRDRLLLELARSAPFAICAPDEFAAALAKGPDVEGCLARQAALG